MQQPQLKFAIFHTVEEKQVGAGGGGERIGWQSFESFDLRQSFLFKAKSFLCLYSGFPCHLSVGSSFWQEKPRVSEKFGSLLGTAAFL